MVSTAFFYRGRAENTRKIVVAHAALEQLTWSNESTFKFNDYATQLINHFNTLERGGQARFGEYCKKCISSHPSFLNQGPQEENARCFKVLD